MDDQEEMVDSAPSSDVVESQESLRELVDRLRSEVETQAKIIGSLGQTLALHLTEMIQHRNSITILQAELHHLAQRLAAQHTQEWSEAQLQHLRAILPPSSQTAHSSSTHTTDLQRQATITNLAQELYHSRRELWEHISELREEVLHIYGLIKCNRDETLRKLTERHECLERMVDTWQGQEELLKRHLRIQEAHKLRSDFLELQSKLQAIGISKGKAPKKTGHVSVKPKAMLVTADSDEALSGPQSSGTTAHMVKEDVSTYARRK